MRHEDVPECDCNKPDLKILDMQSAASRGMVKAETYLNKWTRILMINDSEYHGSTKRSSSTFQYLKPIDS